MEKLRFFGLILILLIGSNTALSQGTDCLTFDGSNDYIQADNDALNAIDTDDFTFEAWINGDLIGQNAHPAIFSNRPVPGNGVMFFFHNNWGGSAYKMLCIQLAGVNYFVFDNGTYDATFFDGTCHHVAITREGSLLTFYADGVSFGTRTIGVGDPTAGSAADLWIGQDIPTNNTFNGHISQIRIWDDVRTEAELFANKDLSISGGSANLVGYWEMNEGIGQLAADKTGTADGQLGSAASPDASDPAWGAECCIDCELPDPCWNTTTLCEGSPTIDLSTLLCVGATSGGIWNGVGVTGDMFDPAGLAGGISISYTAGTDPCDSTFTQDITVLTDGPAVNAGPDQTICQGTAITLTADNPDGAAISWDGGVIDGVAFVPSVGTHTYTVEASFLGGTCTGTDEVVITVTPLPTVAFTVDSVSGCDPFRVTFTNLSTLTSSCFWEFGDGGTATDCGSQTHTYTNADDYDVTLTVTSAAGCTNSVTYTDYISVIQSPIADFSPSSSLLDGANYGVEFTNNSSHADTYVWNFGDGSPLSTDVNASHTYSNEVDGVYEVMLIASTSSPVCSDTAYKLIHAKDVVLIYIPNAITIDGDGFNNTFVPVISSGVDYYDYHMTIFNRWGELIFESYNYDIGWNGEYGDLGIVQPGVFIWQIDFKETGTDERQIMRGHITVFR